MIQTADLGLHPPSVNYMVQLISQIHGDVASSTLRDAIQAEEELRLAIS